MQVLCSDFKLNIMKKIKNLTLKVTSIMKIKDAEVTDEMYDDLCEIYKRRSLFDMSFTDSINKRLEQQSKDLFIFDWIGKNMQSLIIGHKIVKMKI